MIIGLISGAIAQMGERLHGMQEVVGSNPIGSSGRVHSEDITVKSIALCAANLGIGLKVGIFFRIFEDF